MSKTIAISGASGFVGKNLVPYLQSEGYPILRITRDTEHNSTGSLSFEKVEAADFNTNNISAIVHLAGKAHDLKKTTKQTEYEKGNTGLTKKLYDAFLASDATVFIYISSVKAVTDHANGIVTEETPAAPRTAYGISKRKAEEYISSIPLPSGKKYFILRPCMIHGPGNKGNLNLLYNVIARGIPYPLGAFDNKRSFLSVENLCFVITRLIADTEVPGGIYNLSDDEAISTNELIHEISHCLHKKARIWNISRSFIKQMARVCDVLRLPFTSEQLDKLTESYEVSNRKIRKALQRELPVSSREGIRKTIDSFLKK